MVPARNDGRAPASSSGRAQRFGARPGALLFALRTLFR